MESWPIEPLARANKKYAHTPLDEETKKPTSFSSGEELFAFIRGSYGLKGLPNFFTKETKNCPFQLNEDNKMKVISYNARILNPQEQKRSTLDCELLGIVHDLQIYEFLIIGSPLPIHIFSDHKPMLH